MFQFFGLQDLLNRPSKQWMYKNLIGYNDLVMIYGLAWSGKTLVVIDLMMSYLNQSDFGCFEYHERDNAHPTVLYCTDEGLDGLASRFRASLFKHGLDPQEVDRLYFSFDLPNLFSPKHKLNVDTFIKSVKKAYPGPFSPQLIVIDTLRNATIGSSENSNDDAAVIAANIKRIKNELNCTIILIHHSDKAGKWLRGASAFMGDMDCIVKVEGSKLVVEKVKDGTTTEAQAFVLAQMDGIESVAIQWTGEYKDYCQLCLDYLEMNKEMKYTAKQVAEALSASQPTIIKSLKKLANENGVVYSELSNPEKTASNHNPTVYWYSLW